MIVVRGGLGSDGLGDSLAAHWFVHLADYHLCCSFIMERMPSTRPTGGYANWPTVG